MCDSPRRRAGSRYGSVGCAKFCKKRYRHERQEQRRTYLLLLAGVWAEFDFAWGRDEELEAAGAAGGVVEHEADEGLAVVDLVGGDEGEGFGEGEAEDLDLLVVFGLGDSVADVAGEVDLHPLAEEAGAGEVFGEEGPALGAVAGLFDHLAFGGG